MKLDDVLSAIHENRLLVLLECEIQEDCDHSDGMEHHFHQVILTSRQFKQVSDAIILKTKKDDSLKEGYDLAEIRFGNPIDAKPFEGLSSTID